MYQFLSIPCFLYYFFFFFHSFQFQPPPLPICQPVIATKIVIFWTRLTLSFVDLTKNQGNQNLLQIISLCVISNKSGFISVQLQKNQSCYLFLHFTPAFTCTPFCLSIILFPLDLTLLFVLLNFTICNSTYLSPFNRCIYICRWC